MAATLTATKGAHVISSSEVVTVEELERGTGWSVKPEGLCRDERCVPLPPSDGPGVDLQVVAERLRMPLLHDEQHGLWALGPESGGQALQSAQIPDLAFPTLDGEVFPLSRLRGKKVLLAAWASW